MLTLTELATRARDPERNRRDMMEIMSAKETQWAEEQLYKKRADRKTFKAEHPGMCKVKRLQRNARKKRRGY